MSNNIPSEAAKAVVRGNTEEVQGGGNFDVFEELFADDFVDHAPQPSTSPDNTGVRKLYSYLRAAFPDFHAEIHWQLAEGERVTAKRARTLSGGQIHDLVLLNALRNVPDVEAAIRQANDEIRRRLNP